MPRKLARRRATGVNWAWRGPWSLCPIALLERLFHHSSPKTPSSAAPKRHQSRRRRNKAVRFGPSRHQRCPTTESQFPICSCSIYALKSLRPTSLPALKTDVTSCDKARLRPDPMRRRTARDVKRRRFLATTSGLPLGHYVGSFTLWLLSGHSAPGRPGKWANRVGSSEGVAACFVGCYSANSLTLEGRGSGVI